MKEWSKLRPLSKLDQLAECVMKASFIMSHEYKVIASYTDHKVCNFRVENKKEETFDVLCRQINLEKTTYTFISKKHLEQGLRADLFIGLVIFIDGQKPTKYLFPSSVWENPNQLFTSYQDYFPHGEIMPNRQLVGSNKFRHDYQGDYSEKDGETGWNSFDLRMYDAKIGRWFAPDPMEQYWSPYMAMGNNPISIVDPTGGYSDGGQSSGGGTYTGAGGENGGSGGGGSGEGGAGNSGIAYNSGSGAAGSYGYSYGGSGIPSAGGYSSEANSYITGGFTNGWNFSPANFNGYSSASGISVNMSGVGIQAEKNESHGNFSSISNTGSGVNQLPPKPSYYPRDIRFNEYNWDYIFYEGIGPAASFFVMGNIYAFQAGDDWRVKIWVAGSTVLKRDYNIEWKGRARLIIDGKPQEWQNLKVTPQAKIFPDNYNEVGEALFDIPEGAKLVEIEVDVFYIIKPDEGGGRQSIRSDEYQSKKTIFDFRIKK
ncbi:MAG: hypothetical protein K2X86_00685 [Cytophagaceae bacterium]|nr:hypothetical protein [Cytophagaceae bacterium]